MPDQDPDLEQLKQSIDKATEKTTPEEQDGQAPAYGVIIEFIVPIAVGAGLGIYLDTTFETKPVLIIIFILLGFGSGFMNMLRAARGDRVSSSVLNEKQNKKDV